MALSSLLSSCVPETFTAPTVFGSEILSIDAVPVLNYSMAIPIEGLRFVHPSVDVVGISFCNVSVTYTHPNTDTRIVVETWLPPQSAWNERYYAVGGGGYAAGRFDLSYSNMAGAAQEGYAVSSTDAGVATDGFSGDSWVLRSDGNLDLYRMRDFGGAALNDQAIVNKHLIEEFYGKKPAYSYWNGCSQGGRQGMELAQRYPTAYDGIAAGAPAMRLINVAAAIFFPQQLMNVLGEYPYPCEYDAIRNAAVAFCDEFDGVKDGVVQDIEGCLDSFDPFALVGTTVECPQADGPVDITSAAATVANATFANGYDAVGKRQWFGFSPTTDLTGNYIVSGSTASTNCTGPDGCVGDANPLGTGWVRMFAAKDPSFDYTKISMEDYHSLVRESAHELGSFLNTDDADLSRFRDAGGKLITFHGLDDNLISYRNTRDYYTSVESLLGDAHDFYRLFEVPGLAHCWGGTGGQPTSLFEQLRSWVEDGVAPDDTPVEFTDAGGKDWSRILCPFPQEAKYDGACGDAADASCWVCEG